MPVLRLLPCRVRSLKKPLRLWGADCGESTLPVDKFTESAQAPSLLVGEPLFFVPVCRCATGPLQPPRGD